MKTLSESIWSDIQKRSSGETTRKEDDVNLLDLNEFYKYIKEQYKTKVEYIDLDAMGGGNGDVLGVDITEDIILFYKPKRGHILLSWSRVKIPMPFFDELADRFKIENPNVMRRIITEKDGSCTNKTFVDAIEFFLGHKESMMNESIWSDIQKRSAGETIRKEDERHQVMERLLATYIKLFAESCYYHNEYTSGSYPDFRAYINDFRDNPRIEEVCPDDSYFNELLDYVNKETWNDQIIETIMEMTNRLDKGEHLITNEVIEVLRKYNVNESLWSDIQKRSSGETVRKEDDVDSLDLKDFCKYLKEHYKGSGNTIVYHEDDDDFISIVLYMDEAGYFRFLNYNEETISTQYDVLETLNCVSEMKERYRLDIDYNEYDVQVVCIYPKDRTTVNNSFCIDVLDYLLDKIDTPLEQQIVKIDNIKESIWSDIQKRSSGEDVRKEDEMTQDDLDAVDDFIFGFATRVVWDGVRDSLTNFLKYIDENPEALDCDIDRVKKYVEDNWHKGICDDVETAIEQEDKEKEQDLNESLWSDIQKRSSGETIRKEDDINLLDIDGFYDYLTSRYKLTSMNYEITKSKSYIDVPIFLGDRATFMSIFNSGTDKCAVLLSMKKYDMYHYDDFKNALELKYKLDFQYIEKGWYDVHIYPKDDNVDRNNSFVVELIDYILDADKPFKNLIERVVNESIWSDIQKRSSGEIARKEDEILTDDEINAANELIQMYCRHERANYIKHSIVPPLPSNRKENDYEGVIKYIEDRRDENLFTNIGDYDKIIRYIKKNWEKLDIDMYIKKNIFAPTLMRGKKIVECDGVPGGATPADVGGMGAAYFPGPNGEPGSGDLPSPTGIVYHQVAPYTMFLKGQKKKKKKKKFRIEDEPCAHSKNSKTYDYVDDFREYVDRTYNNIDRRK